MIDKASIDPRVDYYAVLGVAKGASQDEIGIAFKRAALKHHPDRGGDQEQFKRANAANQIIGDPEARSYYDSIRSEYASGSNWDWAKYGMSRDEFFKDPSNAGLREFVVQSLFAFQDQLSVIIPGVVLKDFETAVQYVYDTWGELRKTRRVIVQTQRFGGIKVSRERANEEEHYGQ